MVVGYLVYLVYSGGLPGPRLAHQDGNRRRADYRPYDSGDRREQGDSNADGRVPPNWGAVH